MKLNGRRPNFLIIMVDQQRYPVSYETPELKAYLKRGLQAQGWMRSRGMEFHRHYASSTACTPSRATLFTGHYPSLHGVSQTAGAAKGSFDPDMFWLDPNTIPTLGEYFRAGGYRTYYKGKWHFSHSDIVMAGTNESIDSSTDAGKPIPKMVDTYWRANRLNAYGFDGWVGPEPHGPKLANAGIRRDPLYAREVAAQIEMLDAEKKKSRSPLPPWLMVSSFVNPHDIVFFGAAWKGFGLPYTRGWVPEIPKPETERETLDTKPSCQKSYVEVYPKMLTPQPTVQEYRQFYYYLQKEVDSHIRKVYSTLENSSFFEDTIVVFTADHGDQLGAHGGMHQKWHNMYEESVHVPLIFSNPVLFREPQSASLLSTHVDLLPTLLDLAGIDAEKARAELANSHTDARPLVGRSLAPMLLGKANRDRSEPLYFMTDDEISSGLNQKSMITGKPYTSVIQPNHVEAVFTTIETDGGNQVWKYARYFDNPQFWTSPFQHNLVDENGKPEQYSKPRPAEFEMYNLTDDPLEQVNLAHPSHRDRSTRKIEQHLRELLMEQRRRKRQYPEPLKEYASYL